MIHTLIRAGLFLVLPVSRASSLGNIWVNLYFIANLPHVLVHTAILFVWSRSGLAWSGVRSPFLTKNSRHPADVAGDHADRRTNHRSSCQFIAFAPVALALIASAYLQGPLPIFGL